MSEIRIGHWTKLGAAIRAARRARSWSQAELADRAGVSRSWLAKLEAGHRGAEFEQILRVMSALDLSLSIHDDSSAEGDAPAEGANPPITKTSAGKAASKTAPAASSSSMGNAPIPVAAASRLLERRQAASSTRRASWSNASEKAGKPKSG